MSETKYNLPRGYLSYSAWDLWTKSPTQFRKRYYENETPFETTETRFGKKIADLLESGIKIDGIDHCEEVEYPFDFEHEGLRLYGRLDGFNPSDFSIIEIKTGHANKDGKAPWDAVKVRKHKQLVFYALVIELMHGQVNDLVRLFWLETEFEKKEDEFDGHRLETTTRNLNLTGRVEPFRRTIEKWERERMLADILRVAREISDDYTKYQNEKKETE